MSCSCRQTVEVRRPASFIRIASFGLLGIVMLTMIPVAGTADISAEGQFSAVAASTTSWETVGGHSSLEDARRAAIDACNNYTASGDGCIAVIAGKNEHYYGAAVCEGKPYVATSRVDCSDVIEQIKKTTGSSSCRFFGCEGGGGPMYGRY